MTDTNDCKYEQWNETGKTYVVKSCCRAASSAFQENFPLWEKMRAMPLDAINFPSSQYTIIDYSVRATLSSPLPIYYSGQLPAAGNRETVGVVVLVNTEYVIGKLSQFVCFSAYLRPVPLSRSQGHADVAGELLSRGVDVNSRGLHQVSGLVWAAGRGHDDVVRVLLGKRHCLGPGGFSFSQG